MGSLYLRRGVLLREKKKNSLSEGVLKVEERPMGIFIVWHPDFPSPCGGADGNGVSPDFKTVPTVDKSIWIELELLELNSYRLTDDGNQLVLIQKDGTNTNPLIFLDEGPEEFLAVIKRHRNIRKSRSDDCLYLITDPELDALDQSLNELNLFDPMSGAIGGDVVWKFVEDIQKDPYTTAMTAFSKLTDKIIYSPTEEYRPGSEEMTRLMRESMIGGAPSGLEITTTTEQHGDDGGEFEVIIPKPNLMDSLPEVLSREESSPLCQMDWELHFELKGNMIDKEQLFEKIFRGGVDPHIRPEVWKYLLGFYTADLTHDQKVAKRNEKVEEYHNMKLQWKTMSAAQEKNFSAFRERKIQIEKDVLRTDRSFDHYSGQDNKNLKVLNDILMTYVMYNFDLGYVQGMSDLLSPILYVMSNEADAFWCFVSFMESMGKNFDLDQGGMKKQLQQLIELEKAVDPEMYSYLVAKDSGNFYFCFRWLLIWFKREFSFEDIMRLWEIIWANPFCQNFHLLICLALLHSEKHTIMENRFGLTEILKHINDLAYNIDVNSVVTKAEAIFLKLNQAEENVPSKILDIIHGRLDCDDGDRTPEEAEEATEARTDGSRSDTGETTS